MFSSSLGKVGSQFLLGGRLPVPLYSLGVVHGAPSLLLLLLLLLMKNYQRVRTLSGLTLLLTRSSFFLKKVPI